MICEKEIKERISNIKKVYTHSMSETGKYFVR